MEELTYTQQEVLKLVKRYQDENDNWYPTLRDLLDYPESPVRSTSSVNHVLSALEVLGYIERREMKSSVRLSDRGRQVIEEYGKPKFRKYIQPWRPS